MRALVTLAISTVIINTLLHSCAASPTLTLLPDNDICQYFKDGVILRQPGYCDRSIKCDGGKSIPDKLCTAGQLFSLTTKACSMKVSDAYCASPCSKTSPRFVSDKRNCEGWYECNGSTTVQSGYCKNHMYFDQSKQLCMYQSQTNCTATYKFCNVVPVGVAFPDADNCHQWLQCSDKATEVSYTCETGTYFDIASGACIKKSMVNCYKHPYPEDVCGTTKVPLRDRFVSDEATCRGYFYCKDQYAYIPDPAPAWGQCPMDMFFNAELEACMPLTQVRCREDRCDGVVDGLTLSERTGCRHYYVCRNNATMDELQCPDGEYFDAVLKKCTTTVQRYSVCLY